MGCQSVRLELIERKLALANRPSACKAKRSVSGGGQGRQPPEAVACNASLEANRSPAYLNNTVAPRRRIRLVTVAGGLAFVEPGWARKTSASLTPATGVRTTRFCRTRYAVRLHAVDRSQAARLALRSHRAPTLPRPPHPIPTFVTIAIRPSFRAGMARACRADLPDGESGIFFARGLDRKSLICPSGGNAPLAWVARQTVGWVEPLRNPSSPPHEHDRLPS